MEDLTMPERLHQQEIREEEAYGYGVLRFRKRWKSAKDREELSMIGATKKLLQLAIEPTIEAVQYWLDSHSGPGRPPVALRWVSMAGAEVAAFIACRCLLDTIHKPTATRELTGRIAGLVMDELRFRRLKEEAPGLFHYRMDRFDTGHYGHRKYSLNQAITYADVDVSDLQPSESERLHLGSTLLNLCLEATGLAKIEVHKVKHGSRFRTEHMVIADEETDDWIEARNAALEVLRPVTGPMVVPPLPWDSGKRGGYRFALRDTQDLVRGVSEKWRDHVDSEPLPLVYTALNRIQETPWRINRKVFDLLRLAREGVGGLQAMPALEDEPLPPKPDDIDYNEEARRLWRRDAAAVHDKNHRRRIRAREALAIVTEAGQLAEYEAFWYVWNLDFRGRMYPVGSYLTPHGDDMARSLLEFSHGKRLGSAGWKWLAIHGANRLGTAPNGRKIGRMTYRERIEWVLEHSDMIVQAAEDPFGELWWQDADDPFQFYAFACEWAEYMEHGEDYVCHLPISVDGTCNGLQHYAAMLRDEQGARTVNVAPTSTPRDIYADVAQEVERLLETRPESLLDDPAARLIAEKWLASGLVDRSLAKRPTMTIAYGAKQYGFTDQVLHHLTSHPDWLAIRRLFTHEGREMTGDAARLMAAALWQALQGVVPSAESGMAWLQAGARAVVATGEPVYWTVPLTGFPVKQEYFESTSTRIETILAGSLWRPRLYHRTSDPLWHEQVNGIAPNYVHSLDAAALMLTVSSMPEDTCWLPVHDSYGTHAADMPRLQRVLREEFVRLHREPVMENLWSELQEQAAEELDPPPSQGSFDLESVVDSDYFFS